jgi:hypothetical protein
MNLAGPTIKYMSTYDKWNNDAILSLVCAI